MTILVTGGAGFIGSHIVEHFQALDKCATVGTGQRAQRANPCARKRAVDDSGEVLVNLAFYLSRGSDRRRRDEAAELVLVDQHVQQAPHF